ncbi:MAG: hypothetical protein GQ542_19040 [Desulforhopalus sp.]|nr:hypothetical protein [Desulforhopalus sp.]
MSPGRPVQQAADVLAAPCVVTCRVFGQESAEAILGAGSHPKGAWETGNEPGEEKSLEDSPR